MSKREERMEPRRVVVTGVGIVSPVGITADETWQSITTGRSGVRSIALFDASTFPVQFAAEVKGFSADTYVAKRETRRLLSR